MADQELYCHDCGTYLRFKIKPWKSGNLTIVCDNCGHRHMRVVVRGVVTGDRWGNGNTGWFRRAPKKFGVMANSNEKSLWEEQNE